MTEERYYMIVMKIIVFKLEIKDIEYYSFFSYLTKIFENPKCLMNNIVWINLLKIFGANIHTYSSSENFSNIPAYFFILLL